MAEISSSGTLYGQFGHAIYDQDVKQWRFEHVSNSKHAFYPLGEWKVVIPPATVFPKLGRESASKEYTKGRRRQDRVKALAQLYPEIQPAAGLLPDLARLSEAVEDAAARHDPVKGDLLAFGMITDRLGRARTEVAVFPCGPSGSHLRVVQVRRENRGWGDSKAVWIEVPTFTGEEAIWRGPGVPIQSVAFAQPIGSGPVYLAIRLLTQILIFHPLLKDISSRGPSRLDLNFLYKIRIDQIGIRFYAHMTFNPWHTQQFAVVDQAGNWSVQELVRRDAHTTKEISGGNLMNRTDEAGSTLEDVSWSRILWVGDSTIIGVCTRERLLLFDLVAREKEPLQLPRMTRILENGLCWNLDIALIPFRSSHFVLLTSTHVLIYYAGRDSNETVSSGMKLCARHFRNPKDISMRLHVSKDNEDVLILIHSQLNTEVTSHRLNFADTGHITIGDPTELPLRVSALNTAVSVGFSALHVHPVPIKIRKDVRVDQSIGAWSAEHVVRFYSISILAKNFSVLQHLYYSRSGKVDRMSPPVWVGVPKVSKSSAKAIEEDDFIEPDEPEASETEEVLCEPSSVYVQHRQARKAARSGEAWTMNYEFSARQLTHIDVTDVTDVNEILSEARDVLQRSYTDDATPFRTLLELTGGEVSVRELEEVDSALDDLQHFEPLTGLSQDTADGIEHAEIPGRLISQTIPLPSFLALSSLNRSGRLSSVHSSIVENWITPVSDELPEIVQSTREQLARRIATEVALASQVIRMEKPKAEQQQRQTQSQELSQELPVQPHFLPSPSRTTPSVYFDASSQPRSSTRPSPSPSQPQSAISNSSHPSSASALEISRLSRYTTFSKSAPPFMPKSLHKVLSHWKLEEDPTTYDWRITSRNLSLYEEELESEGLTEKERLRMQRRTERYVRRQRREAEESQRLRMLSSQAPEIVSASQPTQSSRAHSSQPTDAVSSQIMASQVVPGRHGSRRPARKKRKSGF